MVEVTLNKHGYAHVWMLFLQKTCWLFKVLQPSAFGARFSNQNGPIFLQELIVYKIICSPKIGRSSKWMVQLPRYYGNPVGASSHRAGWDGVVPEWQGAEPRLQAKWT